MISLLGMLTGTLVVRLITTPLVTWIALLSLLVVHLTTNYLAVRAVIMTSLNRQRANIVFSNLLSSGRVLDPGEVAERERVFEADGVLRWSDDRRLGWAKIGVSLGRLLERMGTKDGKTGSVKIANGGNDLLNEQEWHCCRRDGYLLWWDKRESTAYITLGDKCEPWQQSRAWMQALMIAAAAEGIAMPGVPEKQPIEQQPILNHVKSVDEAIERAQEQAERTWQMFVVQLKRKGWDLDTAVLETRPGTRLSST